MDRLSNLPDEICRKIASSLLMHEGVKVTVLSRRWNRVFSSIPRMIFSYNDFPNMANKLQKFAEFINRTISRHDDSSIEEFQLWFDVAIRGSTCLIDDWIKFAISRNVKHLSLFLRVRKNQMFPDCFFTCKSLESIRLGVRDRFLTFPQYIDLPMLKTLHLFDVVLSEGDSIKHLVSSCPALEYLIIELSFFNHFDALVVSSVSLINLTIQNCGVFGVDITVNAPSLEDFNILNCFGLGTCEINLTVPSLQNFTYHADMAKDIKFQDILSLSVARIVFQGSPATYRSDHSAYAAKMLKGIQAELLTLDNWFLEHLLPFSTDALMHLEGTSFGRVEYLQLIWSVEHRVQEMAALLRRFHNLKVLWITILSSGEHLAQGNSIATNSEDVDAVEYLNQLEYIEVEGFDGRESELDIVEFLLNKASVLELLEIIPTGEIEDDDVLEQTIIDNVIGFPRASPGVEIVFWKETNNLTVSD